MYDAISKCFGFLCGVVEKIGGGVDIVVRDGETLRFLENEVDIRRATKDDNDNKD